MWMSNDRRSHENAQLHFHILGSLGLDVVVTKQYFTVYLDSDVSDLPYTRTHQQFQS